MANKNVIWCDPSTLSKDLSGKVYIVTGANSGVGLETTQQLVKQGAHVVMACRRVESGQEVAKAFSGLKGSFEVLRCDLADLESVRSFVDTFKSRHERLDGLACNAGMVNMDNTPKYSKDGFETTMAASFFGHFLMTEMLVDLLVATPESRMLILSSVVHAGSPKKRYSVHLDDLDWTGLKVLEYGSGNSSAFYCDLGAQVTSIEHDAEWTKLVSDRLSDRAGFIIHHEAESGAYARRSELADADVVVIDGTFRTDCARYVVSEINAGRASPAMLIVDNSDWFPATVKSIDSHLPWIRVDFSGFVPINTSPQSTTLYLNPERRIPRRDALHVWAGIEQVSPNDRSF